jgi:anti-sigma factor ChrR (cupin superfamily)
MNEDIAGVGHPSAEDMAAYLDGRIGEADRERIEAHAAECAECRREIAEVTAMLTETRSARGWRVWAPAAAAAAVVALLVLRPFSVPTESVGAARYRGPASTSARARPADIRTVSPADNAAVGLDGADFVWRSRGPEASYQLTLTDAEGSVIWNVGTTDTVARLPDTIHLAPASTYYWYVDVLLEDGRHATSGVHSFTTRP